MLENNYFDGYNLNGLICSEDASFGTLTWSFPENEYLQLWATPNWESDNEVPFAVTDSDGEYTSVLNLLLTGTVEEKTKLYLDTVEFVANRFLK